MPADAMSRKLTKHEEFVTKEGKNMFQYPIAVTIDTNKFDAAKL